MFLNSRERPNDLSELLVSILSTAKRYKDLEIFVSVDNDDKTLEDYKSIFQLNWKIALNPVIADRPTNLHKSINKMAGMSSGDLLMVLNDDVRFLTENWDRILFDTVERRCVNTDYIYYIGPADNSCDKKPGWNYASFPILTKEAHAALGYFMNEQFVGLGGDVHLYRLFKSVARVIQIPEIELDHIYHTTVERVLSPDTTASDMRANSYSNWVDPFTCDISNDVEKIRRAIWKETF